MIDRLSDDVGQPVLLVYETLISFAADAIGFSIKLH